MKMKVYKRIAIKREKNYKDIYDIFIDIYS